MKKAFKIKDLAPRSVPAPSGPIKQIFSILIATVDSLSLFNKSAKSDTKTAKCTRSAKCTKRSAPLSSRVTIQA